MGIQKDHIAQRVVKVAGISERRTLELLPDMYKQKEKVEAGRVGDAISAETFQQKRAQEKVEAGSVGGQTFALTQEQKREQGAEAMLISPVAAPPVQTESHARGTVVVHGTRLPPDGKRNNPTELTKTLTDFIVQRALPPESNVCVSYSSTSSLCSRMGTIFFSRIPRNLIACAAESRPPGRPSGKVEAMSFLTTRS